MTGPPGGSGAGCHSDPTYSYPVRLSISAQSSLGPGSDNGPRHDGEALAEAADLALETGRWVHLGGYVLIPDTLAVEMMANNPDQSWPRTWALRRDDGRIVHAFRAPRGWLR
jgi:hypothetical protein